MHHLTIDEPYISLKHKHIEQEMQSTIIWEMCHVKGNDTHAFSLHYFICYNKIQ
jgi:hypothetical protein